MFTNHTSDILNNLSEPTWRSWSIDLPKLHLAIMNAIDETPTKSNHSDYREEIKRKVGAVLNELERGIDETNFE